MKRREFITLVGGAAVAWPMVAGRHSSPLPFESLLFFLPKPRAIRSLQQRAAVVKRTLQELGWTEGRNIQLEFLWFGNESARAKRLAAELVALAPDAILAQSTPGIEAVRAATTTISTMFVVVTDPVGSGVVASLARPNTNMTGFSSFEPEIGTKWLETLKEVAPHIQDVAVLLDPDFSAFTAVWKSINAAAPTMGLKLIEAPIRTLNDIEPAITAVAAA